MGYFAYHAVEGDYGLFALGKLKDRVASLEAELATARAEREQMERHVALMRPESLDRDMIDERAREALNMADAKDIVIFLDPADRTPRSASPRSQSSAALHLIRARMAALHRNRWRLASLFPRGVALLCMHRQEASSEETMAQTQAAPKRGREDVQVKPERVRSSEEQGEGGADRGFLQGGRAQRLSRACC